MAQNHPYCEFSDGLIVRPVQSHEIHLVEQVINRSFSADPNRPTNQSFFNQFHYIPRQREELFWGAFLNGQAVGGLVLIPHHIMIWYCPLHLVAMTGVGVLPQFRHQNIASRLIQTVHKFLPKQGFDGVALHSAQNALYLKNGYQSAFYEMCFEISWTYAAQSTLRNLLERKIASGKYVEFFLSHELTETISEELYWVRHQSTPFVRRSIRHIRNPNDFHQKLLQFLDNNAILAVIFAGKDIRAYAIATYAMNILTIFEQYSLLNDTEDYLLLWEALIEEYDNSSLKLQVKTFPTDEKVMKLGKQFSASFTKNDHTQNMVYLFDPSFILPWMQTTFCQRVANSDLRNQNVQFILNINDKSFLFRVTATIVSLFEITTDNTFKLENFTFPILNITKQQWMELVFGYTSFENVLSTSHQFTNVANFQSLQSILDVLFPELIPIWDYFEGL